MLARAGNPAMLESGCSTMSDKPIGLDIFRTALPMRTFEHAAAKRSLAESIVVRLRTAEGRVGWGETLPREYVTGETLETVRQDIEQIFWPIVRGCRDLKQVRQAVVEMPFQQNGRVVTAARCAVELATIQAFGLWAGESRVPPEAWPRVTGVIGSSDPGKTARKLRLMRWYGLRSFKLKLGMGEDVDQANLQAVHRQLSKKLASAQYDLRVDANSAWKYAEVPDRVKELKALGVCAVEQPCKARPSSFVELSMKCALPLIADESCLTEDDAEVLLGSEGHVWLNVRISKNGGLAAARRLAGLANRDGVPYVLGCMVGESGILSTAQRALLSAGPTPLMLEGNYGRLLLKDDLTDPSPRFGYRGRLCALPKAGWSIGRLDPPVHGARLRRYGEHLASLE